MDTFGFKDLDSVRLKATYDIEIGNRTIEEGETIAYFDSIQIAGLQELKDIVSANGGYGNRAHVWWETTREVNFAFSQGVFSKEQFAVLMNSKLISVGENSRLLVPMREVLESDENGEIICKHNPYSHIYVYNLETGEKMEFTYNENVITIEAPFLEVIVDYAFDYNGNSNVFRLGDRLLSGYVSLEGKTRVKDDTTGQVVTGLIRIPRLKLMSDLSIRLGAQASPVVANFSAKGVPVGSRGNSYVSEFYLLSDYVDSDL